MLDLICPVIDTVPFDALWLTEPADEADSPARNDSAPSWSENFTMAEDEDVEDDAFFDDDDDEFDDDDEDDDFLDDDDEYFDDDDDELFDDDDEEFDDEADD